MSLANVFFSPDVIFAVCIFATLAFVEPFLEQWLHNIFETNPSFQLGWDYFFSPALRAMTVVLFVYLAYPGIFGLTTGPTFNELSASGQATPSNVIGVLFLIGLILPVVPLFNRHPEFILPIQGSLAAAYVFVWVSTYLNITTVSMWPGIDSFIYMLLISYLGHRLAQRIGSYVGEHFDRQYETRGLDIVARHVVELLVQIPVILTYGWGLGLQIAM